MLMDDMHGEPGVFEAGLRSLCIGHGRPSGRGEEGKKKEKSRSRYKILFS